MMFVPKCRHIPPISVRAKYAGLKDLNEVPAMTAPKVMGIMVAVKNGILASLTQMMSE